MRGIEDKWKGKVTFINKSMTDQAASDLMSQLGFNGVPSVVLFDASGKETNGVALGAMRTYAQSSGEFTYTNWIEAVRAGRTYVSNGPLLNFTTSPLRSVPMFRSFCTAELQ